MGFLKKIFGKKKGGTKVGNLIRGVANKVSGGKIGTGKNMIKDNSTIGSIIKTTATSIPQTGGVKSSTAFQTGSVVGDYLNAMVGPKVEKVVQEVADNNPSIVDRITGVALNAGKDSVVRKAGNFVKTNWLWLLIPGGLLVWLIFRPKGKATYRGRR